MPIPQNSHSSKPMVTFIKKLPGLFGMAVWSKITAKPDFLTAKGIKKPRFYHIGLLFGIFCSDWWKSQALLLFCPNCHSHGIGNKILMNGTKMHFDECDFPWMGLLRNQFSVCRRVYHLACRLKSGSKWGPEKSCNSSVLLKFVCILTARSRS